MPAEQQLASQVYVKLDGAPAEEQVLANLLELVVDQHSHLPDMFTLRLNDPGLELLDNGPFDLTKTVEIEAANEDGEKFTLLKGEITALEPAFNEGMLSELVVRGYDKSHRLYRELKSKAFLNKKDSDLASEIAQAAGLQVEAEATNTVYDHIYQHNQSDLAFLLQRAWRIGYECFVDEGKLYFRKPPSSGDGVTLTWGQDLLSFQPRMTLAEQVDEVLVKGWDVDKQQAIVGQASNGRLYPSVQESKNGADWASAFGSGKKVIVDQPVVSQAEADALAAARLDELSGAFIEATGVAFRRPDIRAGRMVQLEALGNRFSGKYLVTGATHLYTPEGLQTTFTVRGARTGLLAEQMSQQPPLDRWPGVVPAVVTNTDDPNDWGRVKVKFPWMADDAESGWARVVGVGAGPEAGLFVMPEVGDEVLVAFEHGDFSRPFVLGGLWNGQHKLPAEAAGAAQGEKPLVRTWHSRTGHRIAVYDDAKKKVEIVTKDGHAVTLDDANKKIEIKSQGGLTITLDDNGRKIVVESNGNIEVKAQGSLKLQAGSNMDIQAGGQVTVKGAVINLN
ncbi:MAG: VgrG-related protein [Chloroflexi bacterium]|nr:VgrG-related protein [Chloroflexota bacterium]MCI0574684.1 VgrG-related protein [Chloroflexota bacterium]MCI0647423.1 VgrG-related protein [Chloroflexota bacterium]MCI0726869.1 VgrG-related protein [Chloroflexota bacterium]